MQLAQQCLGSGEQTIGSQTNAGQALAAGTQDDQYIMLDSD